MNAPSSTPSAAPAEAAVFGGYPLATGLFDEMFASPGEVRPAWRTLAQCLERLGPVELTRRWQRTQNEIREDGVTYNSYHEDAARQRPWELDVIPLVFASSEWRSLEAGVVQRARLLNRILIDLHGPQDLLRRRRLPAEWLYGHPGFQRRFHAQQGEPRDFITVYAADLARSPDGRWWVVADRTDAPLGLGYALENRIAASRMLPLTMRDCQVERLAHFFIALQEVLRGLSPERRENPRIVLLSQGPGGPNYFEDAYLARYLGYTLVEGGDLAVRHDHVYLKTLAGLLPVDVIWRRLSDVYCDPLEVPTEQNLGVPGLLQAVRLGTVAVANGLGSALVESASLWPFLPELARDWFGDDLLLPSAPTWWPGRPADRDALLGVPDGLQLRSAYRVARREASARSAADRPAAGAVVAGEGEPVERAQRLELVAQQPILRSTAPVWSRDRAEPWHVAMRVFAVLHHDVVQVLPGALVRLSRQRQTLDASVLAGEISKDAWVLADGPVRHATLLPTSRDPIVLRRSGAEVPSRVADNLFWFGRRVERAQNACRLLRPVVAGLIGEESVDDSPGLPTLVHCLAANGQIEPGFAVEAMRPQLPTVSLALPTATLDAEQPGSLRATFEQAHGNASLVRDRLSLDSWRIVHRISRKLSGAAERVQAGSSQSFELVDLDELLDELIVDFAALDGLFGESMTRSPAWHFLELGRRLERALYCATLVQSLLATRPANEAKALEAVLQAADSLMTYRSRYLAAVHWATALDLLLTDDTNPRSLAFQLLSIADHVAHLPRGAAPPLGTAEDRITLSLVQGVRMLDVADLSPRPQPARSRLDKLLQRVTDLLPKLSDFVSHRYLIHAGRPQQLSEGGRP